jgi:hypothetical protein
MDRDLLTDQLQEAVGLEDKFILEFDSFFKEHVSDNYHLTDPEKEFVDKRIKILLVDSKRHLGLFRTILEEISTNKDLIL